MTNRERAMKVFEEQAKATMDMNDPISPIERALDEVLQDGMKDGYDLGFVKGKEIGQREMRERAANYIDHEITDGGTVFAKAIRALPIEKESYCTTTTEQLGKIEKDCKEIEEEAMKMARELILFIRRPISLEEGE